MPDAIVRVADQDKPNLPQIAFCRDYEIGRIVDLYITKFSLSGITKFTISVEIRYIEQGAT